MERLVNALLGKGDATLFYRTPSITPVLLAVFPHIQSLVHVTEWLLVPISGLRKFQVSL